MNYRLLTITAAVFLAAALSAPAAYAQTVELKTEEQKLSYGVGVNVARNIARQGLQIDADIFAAAVKDVLSGGKIKMTDEEIREVLVAMQLRIRMNADKKRKSSGAGNKVAGEKFLAANKKKTGVVTTSSGLQYKIIREGKGKSPGRGDRVTVHYRGTLISGEEFDSSYKRGKPAEFGVTKVIAGWTEILQLMKPGGKRIVYIPPNLAYGKRGAGAKIGPQATLIFEIALVAIH